MKQMNNLWEISMFDWSQKGNEGYQITPDIIISLAFAETEEEATKLFFKIENIVLDNRLVFYCTIITLKTILVLLPICSNIGKKRCLELLGEIAASDSSDDAPGAIEACLMELKQNSGYFIHGLQFDEPKNVWYYVDILGILGEVYEDMNEKVITYLKFTLGRELDDLTIKMIQNTIDGITFKK